jgi:uncharacterized protein YunC (DUF1805 family)
VISVIEIIPVEINESTVIGVKIGDLDSPEKPVIIVSIAKRGLTVCRNFDIDALNERFVAADRVEGLTKLASRASLMIESCTSKARALGVTEGMTGKEAIMRKDDRR